MPTVAKSTGKLSVLGDLSTFEASSSAIPFDTTDSSGSVPTFNATFANGVNTEYLIGETLTIENPTIGQYSGEIVSVTKAANSNRHVVDSQSIMARLNSDLRLYPLSDYAETESVYMPLYSLEYWSQQCGIFFTKVPGDVLFYQSNYGHLGAYAKGINRPVRAKMYAPPVGGEVGHATLVNGRVAFGYGMNFTSQVILPKSRRNGIPSMLPVLIPRAADTGYMTFGADVMLDGVGRAGKTTFRLVDGKGKTFSIHLNVDSEYGFSLGVQNGIDTPVSLGSIAAGRVRTYHVTVDVRYTNATTMEFTFTVLGMDNELIGTTTGTFVPTATGSMTLLDVTHYGDPGGYGSETLYFNAFVSRAMGKTLYAPVDQKQLVPGRKATPYMIGFSGNVWEHIKQYCSIYHLDISYEAGKLLIGPRKRDISVGASLSERNTTLQKRDQARNVEVVNQNHKPTGNTPVVLWKADSVYQIAVGEVQEFTVQTEHSILETSQPVCVSGISPFPYKAGVGQYVVTGSDGFIVSPTFWRDQGGSITTDTTDVEGEIKITIKGPDYDSPRAPYRISEGDAGRPALYVTGLGLLAEPKTIKVPTGNRKAAKDVGVTLDSPFISNTKLAFDAAARAARAFAAPSITTTISEPLQSDEISKLGTYPAGKLVKHDGNIMRVISARQGYSSFSGTTEQHNTIYQLKRSFPRTRVDNRINAMLNPKAVGTLTGFSGYVTGNEVGTTLPVSGATDGPMPGITTYGRRTVTTAKTAGSTGWGVNNSVGNRIPIGGVAGDSVAVALWMRYTGSAPTLSGALRTYTTSSVGVNVNSRDGSIFVLPSGQWVRVTGYVTATGTFDAVTWWFYHVSTNILPVGATLDATAALVEKGTVAGAYFDGDTANALGLQYSWDAAPNASTSTESAVTGTIRQFNDYHAGKDIGQVNIKPLKQVK